MIKYQKILLFLVFFQANWLINAHQPITLFCHGIVDNHTQINRYKDFIINPKKSFDFPDAQKPSDLDLNTLIFNTSLQFGKSVNRNKMAMSYGIDIETLQQQIHPDKNYILYGVSRGGATIINYISNYNPENIRALILDSTPADIVDSINAWQYTIGYKFAPDRATQETIFHSLFPAYPKNSIPTVQAIANIHNKDLPIFIVNSQDDERVSITSAWQLYLTFKQSGFEHVYLCQLEHGVHANYMNGPDKDVYLQALHSFYKTYEFAYNPNYATLPDLTNLQPSIEDITEKLHRYKEKIESNYKMQQLTHRNYTLIATIALITTGFAHHIYNQNNSQSVDFEINKKVQLEL